MLFLTVEAEDELCPSPFVQQRSVNEDARREIIWSSAIRRILVVQAASLLAPESLAGAPRDLRTALLVDLLVSLTRWWLDRESPHAVNEVDAMFHELAAGIFGDS